MSRFTKYVWLVTLYIIGVIVWGAVVRATGSGAGCGNYWPTCNGAILPSVAELETFVEFFHRITSAIAGFLVLGMAVWAYRSPQSNLTRRYAMLSLLFIVIESLLGMFLVRMELVEDNSSALRAVMIALHLLNTLVLLGFLTLTGWASQRHAPVRFLKNVRVASLTILGLVGLALLSAAGAVTALGDTLIHHGVIDESTEHFLVDLRVIHPVMSIGVSAYLVVIWWQLREHFKRPLITRYAWIMTAFIVIQLLVGVLNIALRAPVWMQMLHLFLADVLWIVAILLTAEGLTESEETAEQPAYSPVPATSRV